LTVSGDQSPVLRCLQVNIVELWCCQGGGHSLNTPEQTPTHSVNQCRHSPPTSTLWNIVIRCLLCVNWIILVCWSVDLNKMDLFWCLEATQHLLNIDESCFQDYHTWYSLKRFKKTKHFETCLIYFDKKWKSLLKVLQMITFLIIASKWLLINW